MALGYANAGSYMALGHVSMRRISLVEIEETKPFHGSRVR